MLYMREMMCWQMRIYIVLYFFWRIKVIITRHTMCLTEMKKTKSVFFFFLSFRQKAIVTKESDVFLRSKYMYFDTDFEF